MGKKLLTMIIILTMTLGIVPADIAMAEEPDPVYYTIHFDNYKAMNEVALSTGEKPYDGLVHTFGFVYGKKTYELFLSYRGYYGDVADKIFFNEKTNDVIFAVDNTAKLKRLLYRASSFK